MGLLSLIDIQPLPTQDEFISGYPGISASSSSTPTLKDPLISLSCINRSGASISGIIEIKSNSKSTKSSKLTKLKAKWLKIELEKVEVINTFERGESKFSELIGEGPLIIWESEGIDDSDKLNGKSKSKNGEFDEIPQGYYPFNIRLSIGLPPSVEIEGSRISYQLISTLCLKGKKGLFQSQSKTSYITSTAPIRISKYENLPFPIHFPLLSLPLPKTPLPWTNFNAPTTGEIRSVEVPIHREVNSDEKIRMKCFREGGAFGPGDEVKIRVEILLDSNKTANLTRLEFSLQELTTLRHLTPVNSTPTLINHTIFNKSLLHSSPKYFTSIPKLHPKELASFDLIGTIPPSHSKISVRTGKFIEINYSLKIEATIELNDSIQGTEIYSLVIEDWNILIGPLGKTSAEIMIKKIGWVEKLCERKGLEEYLARIKKEKSNISSPIKNVMIRPPRNLNRLRANNNSNSLRSSTSARLDHGSDSPPSTKTLRPELDSIQMAIQSPTPATTIKNEATNSTPQLHPQLSPPQSISLYPTTLPPLSESPTSFSLDNVLPKLNHKTYSTAEEEKIKLYNLAKNSADLSQYQLRNSTTLGGRVPPGNNDPSLSNDINSNRRSESMSAEEEKAKLYEAAVRKRNELQGVLASREIRTEGEGKENEYSNFVRESNDGVESIGILSPQPIRLNNSRFILGTNSENNSAAKINHPFNYNNNYSAPSTISSPRINQFSPSHSFAQSSTSRGKFSPTLSPAPISFYSNAVANASNYPTIEEEKSNYFRAIQQRDEIGNYTFPSQTIIPSNSSTPLQNNYTSSFSSQSQQSTTNSSRFNQNSTFENEFKTAAEEKEEIELSRRLQDRLEPLFDTNDETIPPPFYETRVEVNNDEDENENNVTTTTRNGNDSEDEIESRRNTLGADDEKKAYYVAKAEVEAYHRLQSNLTPSSSFPQHQQNINDSELLTTEPDSPPYNYSFENEQLRYEEEDSIYSTSSSNNLHRNLSNKSLNSEESSNNLHRDPSIAAGKRVVRSTSSQFDFI